MICQSFCYPPIELDVGKVWAAWIGPGRRYSSNKATLVYINPSVGGTGSWIEHFVESGFAEWTNTNFTAKSNSFLLSYEDDTLIKMTTNTVVR